jgi:medium-chain acyl-[acyl-carrier-protein] hydrolase
MSSNKWFNVRPARNVAALRLFCFPHVGAGASAFNLWKPAWIPDNIELWTVRLPGREQRLSETPFRHMGPLVDALYEAMATQLSGPYAFYGHSLGAVVAFEMARRIQRQGGPGPIRLLISAHTAPQLGLCRPVLYNLPDKEFVNALRRFAGTPDEALDNEDLMSIMMMALRADFEVDETYSYEEGPPLDCPISAFGGIEDRDVAQADLEAWKTLTSQKFTLQMMEGDHFFIFRSPDFLLRLTQELKTDLQEAIKP